MGIKVCVSVEDAVDFPSATSATTPHDESVRTGAGEYSVLHVYSGTRRLATFRNWMYWVETQSTGR